MKRVESEPHSAAPGVSLKCQLQEQAEAGGSKGGQGDPSVADVAGSPVDRNAEPVAEQRDWSRDQEDGPEPAAEERGIAREQKRQPDNLHREDERLSECASLLLADAGERVPHDERRARKRRKAADHATGRADEERVRCARCRAWTGRCPAQERPGRVADQHQAEPDLQFQCAEAGQERQPERHAGNSARQVRHHAVAPVPGCHVLPQVAPQHGSAGGLGQQ